MATCNHFHNILRPFDVLPNFLFTTSETWYISTYKHDMYDLSHELQNNLRLKVLNPTAFSPLGGQNAHTRKKKRKSTKKVQSCQNNPENSYTEKKVEHKPSGYAWCSICSFDETKNRRYFHREKDCIEKSCKDLKELGTEIINFEEKEMIPLTNKEIKSYEKQKVCHIRKKKFCYDGNNEKEFKNKKN